MLFIFVFVGRKLTIYTDPSDYFYHFPSDLYDVPAF